MTTAQVSARAAAATAFAVVMSPWSIRKRETSLNIGGVACPDRHTNAGSSLITRAPGGSCRRSRTSCASAPEYESDPTMSDTLKIAHGTATSNAYASHRNGGGRTEKSTTRGTTTLTRWLANSAFSNTSTSAANASHTIATTTSACLVRERPRPATVATTPSTTAVTTMPSRSGTSEVSFPSWNSFVYCGPLPVWYVTDWSHTRPRPHGSAVASHTTTAVAVAIAISRGRRRVYIHQAIGTSAVPTSG